MNYFTSDTHFSDERIRRFSLRPHKNIKKMNKKIVKNWNKCVKNDDFVYHLGDFGNYDIIKKLKGKVILIEGNYEVNDRNKQNKTFETFKKELTKKGFYDVINENGIEKFFPNISSEPIFLTHKPMNCKKEKFNLFGHIHGHCRIKDFGINVGVDCFNYNLVKEENIVFLKNAIENKIFDDNVFCSKKNLNN